MGGVPVEHARVPARWLRAAAAVIVTGSLICGVAARVTPAAARSCPVLVLGAMPLELDPLLARAHVDPTPAYTVQGRGVWSGTVGGARALFALTGIGIVNATRTTTAVLSRFSCVSAVVFSGTSGGDYIGDVMAPARWTLDGRHFLATSPSTLAVLGRALRGPVPLRRTTPTGDPACQCYATGVAGTDTPVTVEHAPRVEVGGDGYSGDGFGGRALPCSAGASDVFGCWPCPFADSQAGTQTTNLTATAPPFLEPSFLLGYGAASATPPGRYASVDMETAAVFAVAAARRIPFIGFRAASDGGGDPLHLPGFPAEFFLYRQLAADNAAATALAFLSAWHAAHP